MNWYYVDAGKQAGPVDEAQFEALIQSGKITPDTLVWREQMANWQPLLEVRRVSSDPSFSPTAAASPAVDPSLAGQVTCVECRGTFPRQNCTQYGTIWVCGTCKPVFLSKAQETALTSAPSAMHYAGFWIRVVAKIVDQIIVAIITFPLTLAVGFSANSNEPQAVLATQGLLMLASILINGSYNIFFVGKYGATPGKMLCQLKIVMADGTPVSYGRATGRFFAEILSGCPTLLIGYIMVAFDSQKRALHDHICGTRVITKVT